MATIQLLMGEPPLVSQIRTLQGQLQAVLKGLKDSGYASAKVVLSRSHSTITPGRVLDQAVVWWPMSAYSTTLAAWKEISEARLLFSPFPLGNPPAGFTLDQTLSWGNQTEAVVKDTLKASATVGTALRTTDRFMTQITPPTITDKLWNMSKTVLVIAGVAGGLYVAHKKGWVTRAHDYLQEKLK